MAVQDAGETPARVARGRLVAVAVFGCIAAVVGAFAIVRWTNRAHGDPDPDGRILAALRPIEGAVPNDAIVVNRQEAAAHWDSCDGRTGTFGWSDIRVIVSFHTTTQPDALNSLADRRMVAIGWTPGPTLASPIGPGRQWTRTLGDGTKAHATLSPWTVDDGQTIRWELTAYAPPHGQRASGC